MMTRTPPVRFARSLSSLAGHVLMCAACASAGSRAPGPRSRRLRRDHRRWAGGRRDRESMVRRRPWNSRRSHRGRHLRRRAARRRGARASGCARSGHRPRLHRHPGPFVGSASLAGWARRLEGDARSDERNPWRGDHAGTIERAYRGAGEHSGDGPPPGSAAALLPWPSTDSAPGSVPSSETGCR